VLMHHPPDLRPGGSGLTDTSSLLPVLKERPQAKAIFFGHTHAWSAEQREGLWGVNVPSVAYSFDATQPTGWLDVRVGREAAEVVLHSLDAAHPRHGERVRIALRDA
jgi:3',5'-cyclic-AMP phosphodiesterase